MNVAKFGGALWVATRRKVSPSRNSRLPNDASQIRVAFSSIAWNTGGNSPGELLMTLRTSEVAVCRSNEFAQLARALLLTLEQPYIFDGNYCLVSEGL